ncbi:pyridoxal-phosphate dependent enzyme [Bordetella petrii]|uniref:pyridoxal-phosphate dependent enzyme n=1 Tax=Bordetella petrii TaxID=94624 RepID=UPI0037329D92
MSLHVLTPVLQSIELGAAAALDVTLKLECVQPGGSFKIRGVGHACERKMAEGARRFISSSGGNAGYAVAYAGRRLGAEVVVVVPATTSERAKNLIGQEGAHVIVHGRSWQEANEHALSLLTPDSAFIHPFDDPLLWEGHGTLVDELAAQMDRPDVIICSVGGGGLLAGVAAGLRRNGWEGVGILAVETAGAASYAAALAAGRPVEIDAISTVATSLGARRVCPQALALADELTIKSQVVSDAAAIRGSADLLDAHRLLTEPACGASIAGLQAVGAQYPEARRVAVVVCGGVGVTREQLNRWLAAT